MVCKSFTHSWTDTNTLYTRDIWKFILTQLHRHIHPDMVGLTLMYKMSESHFLSAFSSIWNDHYKLKAWRKRENMARQDIYSFTHNHSRLQ